MFADRKALIEEIKENERVIGNPVKVGEYTLVPIVEIGTSFIKGVLGLEVILEASISPKSIVFIKEIRRLGYCILTVVRPTSKNKLIVEIFFPSYL